LLGLGYEVFRSLSPSATCDLAILKEGHLLRVEVRTGYIRPNGAVTTRRDHRADILAIVTDSGVLLEGEL
jgi:hypothetical protein